MFILEGILGEDYSVAEKVEEEEDAVEKEKDKLKVEMQRLVF